MYHWLLNMKINEKNKIMKNLLIIGILTLMLLPFISAIGVGSSYSNDIPLELYPGEGRSVFLSLQNQDIEEEITLKGNILKGSEIASLNRESYQVPYLGNVKAEIKVKIPVNASIGQEYEVVYRFAQVPSGEGKGGASFVQSVQHGFKVRVIEKPVEEQPETPAPSAEGIEAVWWILGILVIVAVIVVFYFIFRQRK